MNALINPLLYGRYFHVGSTTGGLLVLGQRVPPYKTRLYNPLTNSFKRLRAQIPSEVLFSVAVTMSPLMVFISSKWRHTLHWADESTKEGEPGDRMFGDGFYDVDTFPGALGSMTEHAGDIFLTDAYGSIISTMAAPTVEGCQLPRSTWTLKMNITIEGPIPGCQYPDNLFYLVESEGELLFVVSGPVYNGQPVVYRVDTKNCLLEPVRSIGAPHPLRQQTPVHLHRRQQGPDH